jgi:hypothetical protein
MDGRPGAALRTGPGSHNPTARGKIQPCRDGPCAPLTVPWILSSTSRSANHDDGASYLRWVGRVDGTAALAAARGLKDYGTPKEDVHYDYRRPVGRRRQLPVSIQARRLPGLVAAARHGGCGDGWGRSCTGSTVFPVLLRLPSLVLSSTCTPRRPWPTSEQEKERGGLLP